MEGDKKLTILLSQQTHDMLKAHKRALRLSMSRIVEFALQQYFARLKGNRS